MTKYSLVSLAKDLFTPSSREFKELKKAVIKGTDAEFKTAIAKYGTELRCPVGTTVLHYAVTQASFSRIRKLVEAGADLNAQNKHGTTPMMLLVMFKSDKQREAILSYLLKQGADPDIQTSSKLTALHIAAQKESTYTRILLEAGADRNLEDDRGETPYDIAAGSRYYWMTGVFAAVPEKKQAQATATAPQSKKTLKKNNPTLISAEHAQKVKSISMRQRGQQASRP